MRHGDYAWLTLAVGVLAYEFAAPPGQLLSEAAHRYMQRHPVLTQTVICYLALHLMRRIPERIDPLHRLAQIGR